MNDKNDILNILNAVNEINSRPKKKTEKTVTSQISVPKLNQESFIPPDVDRIIREAEEFQKFPIILSKTSSNKNEILESKNEDPLILTDEIIDNNENHHKKITELKEEVKKLKEIEKKLLSQIAYFKNNKVLQPKSMNDTEKTESLESVNNTTKTLKSIYKQVEEQKQLFLNLKNHSIKIERDSDVYKENYERLIIENNELKKRLKITKEQIANYEVNNKDLSSTLDQLNEILSKNNIAGNISPLKLSSEKVIQKKDTKNDSIE